MIASAVVAAPSSSTNGVAGAASASTIPPVVATGAAIKAAVKPQGRDFNDFISVDGTERTFTVYVPRSLPKHTAVPLLVALHGGLGNASQFEATTDFDGLAESNHFIVAYPDGTPITSITPNRRVWNAGGCCSVAEQSRDDVDDVGFISEMITFLERSYDIDKTRVFVTGHSNGAMLGLRLACQLSATVDAVAVQSGDLFDVSCNPSHPVSVLEIHGTADPDVPIDGGPGAGILKGYDFPPPLDALETLAAQDNCPSTPADSTDTTNAAVSFEVWEPCIGGAVVEWAKVSGAGHAWMGHSSLASMLLQDGPPYMGFDSSAAVWSFLAAHPRR